MLWWRKRRLKASRPDARAAAARALAADGSPGAVRALAEALDDPEPSVCRDIAAALARIGGADATRALTAALDAARPHVPEAAADGLVALGAREAVPALVRQLRGDVPSWVVRALDALDPDWRQGAPGKARMGELIGDLLRDREADAAEALLHRIYPGWLRTPEAQEGFRDAWAADLRHPEADRRRRAVARLSRFGARGFGDAYVGALHDPDAGVRLEAVAALRREPVAAAQPRLVELMDDPDDRFPRPALAALRALGWTPSTRAELETAVALDLGLDPRPRDGAALERAALDIAAGDDLDAREKAVEALKRLGSPKAELAALAAEARINDVDRQLAAVRRLQGRGGEDAAAVLETVLRCSDSAAVREAARSALDVLQGGPHREDGRIPCLVCRTPLDLSAVEGAAGARVGLVVQGQRLPLRCGSCGGVYCHLCLQQSVADEGEGVTTAVVSQVCPGCGGRLDTVGGRPGDEGDFDPGRAAEEAALLASRGGFNDALKLITRVIGAAPTWADAWFLRGKIRAEMGDRHGLVEDFREALRHARPGWEHREEAEAYVNPRRR